MLCDRYVASSYVLQRMDGVSLEFLQAINAYADIPDLAVLLTADPAVTAARIDVRGAHSRFETGLSTSRTEAALYEEASRHLATLGFPVVTLDTTDTPQQRIVDDIAARIAHLTGGSKAHFAGA